MINKALDASLWPPHTCMLALSRTRVCPRTHTHTRLLEGWSWMQPTVDARGLSEVCLILLLSGTDHGRYKGSIEYF